MSEDIRAEMETCLRCRRLLAKYWVGMRRRRLGVREFVSPFSRKRPIARKGSQAFPRKVYREEKMHLYFVSGMHFSVVSTATGST